MKFSEILKEQEELTEEYQQIGIEEYQLESQVPQMSIGQQLEILSKVKEIEYQNSLVMMSLERYNAKYEELKREQTELLDKANQKINQLQHSNEILNQNLEKLLGNLSKELGKEISTLSDRTEKLIGSTSQNIDNILTFKLEDISKKSIEYITEAENLKNDAHKRFESFYGRKKWIDYLIIGHLTLTPLILLFLIYWTFFKK